MLKILSLTVFILGQIIIVPNAQGKQPPKQLIQGDCGTVNCETLMQSLRDLFPDVVQGIESQCSTPEILALEVFNRDANNAQIVSVTCWEANKKDDGGRAGRSLGLLPFPGNESEFSTVLPESRYTETLKKLYPEAVHTAQFECASRGGDFLFSESEEDKGVELWCYYQGGATLFDCNNDYISDGEHTRGAGVHEVFGPFDLGETLTVAESHYCELR